jgi:hypothetical protein
VITADDLVVRSRRFSNWVSSPYTSDIAAVAFFAGLVTDAGTTNPANVIPL